MVCQPSCQSFSFVTRLQHCSEMKTKDSQIRGPYILNPTKVEAYKYSESIKSLFLHLTSRRSVKPTCAHWGKIFYMFTLFYGSATKKKLLRVNYNFENTYTIKEQVRSHLAGRLETARLALSKVNKHNLAAPIKLIDEQQLFWLVFRSSIDLSVCDFILKLTYRSGCWSTHIW